MNLQSSKTRRVKFRSALLALLLLLSAATLGQAQDDPFGDGSADPVKLFERGQNAHSHGDLAKAVEFYDEAIKVRPEFAEAEFQRAGALAALGRLPEAESGFRRTIALRKDWGLPYASLGILLVRLDRETEAETFLRQAIKLEPQNYLALRVLADIRFRASDRKETLEFARAATKDPEAPASIWLLRALAESASKDNAAAALSLDRALEIDPGNVVALLERAEMRMAAGSTELAASDLAAAEPLIKGNKVNASRLAADYQSIGRPDDARRVAEAAGLKPVRQEANSSGSKVVGTPEEIDAANSDDSAVARKALEQLLAKNPNNAMLFARLGAAYRTIDAPKSLAYYKRALAIEPANADYATGYSSALVQARRFAEAATLLRQVIAAAPDNYTAHANFATALYELKQYRLAISEYEWLKKAKPDLVVLDYFIATAHDSLGEYIEALAAYENFVARADVKTNQLEIDKVKLRLPALRRQIQLGQGAKRSAGHPNKN